MAKKEAPKFTQVSPSEVRVDYRGIKFLLVEQDRGIYGKGRAIQLYQLDGLIKTHIKEIGWTKSDNNGCGGMERACVTQPGLTWRIRRIPGQNSGSPTMRTTSTT